MPSAVASKQSIDIPVIDISPSNPNAAKDILDAATKFGFVYVENNEAACMPSAHVARMFDLSKEFFQSPKESKETYSINSNKSGKNKGWLSMGTETLDPGNQKRGDFKEAFNLGEIRNNQIEQPLPSPLSTNTTDLTTFTNNCHTLCTRILQLFALGLSIPETWFSDRHDQSKGPSGSILRLLYYPSVPKHDPANQDTSSRADDDDNDNDNDNDNDIRAGAHSDYGSITLLFQLPGQPGLEIKTKDGTWSSVPVDPLNTLSTFPSKPLPILVNIGDLLAYWTDGLLKSTVHRVIFPKGSAKSSGAGDRYSIAYFCHPLDEAELVAVPSPLLVGKEGLEGPEKSGGERGGEVLTARDHLNERLAATYGVQG